MPYFYRRFTSGKFTTMCFPQSYDERKTTILKNIEWETGGITRGVEQNPHVMTLDFANIKATGCSAFAGTDVGSKRVDQ